ncbi:protein rapunzel-like [Protopterus annectens]|uniref:protein rapunzel-like n=1 Tax=Protopterus annectens TaxID=7888 RepID=UPI001CFA3CF6|nr:protein rapunzel-like [Protopterus annectens]XP_043910542.1 protein rapunzel-like [Protopterus annectens]XP_043910543.1 protein rapunzel-like [Protopterus annectens]XP_043910544.1 protein rapunzel-like [Protopterus annectens]XP_043910545.1 protein rapunzel-like [Protopterus annectens]XP_043910546.1 protein rapunzel-like [Protopterus annectens]XP_043910547.1 protein rapunzel-like [Protopterus annectens]
MADKKNYKEMLKKGVKISLDVLHVAFSAAGVLNPIFSVAGSVVGVLSNFVKTDEMEKLKQDFEEIHIKIETTSKECDELLVKIRQDTITIQYSKTESNIKHQFREYTKFIKDEITKEVFVRSFRRSGDDTNLYDLYDGVVGTKLAFSTPILEAYSGCTLKEMQAVCARLMNLFAIGLVALMSYKSIRGDDMEELKDEWYEKMENIVEKMSTKIAEYS